MFSFAALPPTGIQVSWIHHWRRSHCHDDKTNPAMSPTIIYPLGFILFIHYPWGCISCISCTASLTKTLLLWQWAIGRDTTTRAPPHSQALGNNFANGEQGEYRLTGRTMRSDKVRQQMTRLREMKQQMSPRCFTAHLWSPIFASASL